ncbi:MAG: glyoxalase [Rothia sp. (in: high G+C Gram-positive bacteria)]|nr:glyoxalase [Rothia sp. (in: high G+C Gram-positive bacteria)]
MHHIELWTADYKASAPSWDWLLRNLGWKEQDTWHLGKSWRAADASYLVLEQSSDVNGQHDRMRAGLNHLALNCMSRQELDHIRAEAPEHGWAELFADRYPHAGGNQHTALYLENAEGFEVELVV